MRKSVRRQIRSLLSDAEDALGKKTRTERHDNPQAYRARDLLVTASDAVWYGKHTRKLLVSCVRRLLTAHPKPETITPIAALLVDNLAREPEPCTEIEISCTCPHQDINEPYHDTDCPAYIEPEPVDLETYEDSPSVWEQIQAAA